MILAIQCRKTRLASQIFTNISQHSPPLSIFPAAQRVTYLYYLGRFAFSNNHFTRAQIALQAAYDQCHARGLKQRHLILVYLISVNIILGRFPSSTLLQRQEASGLGQKFWPVCQAIARGDLAGFKKSLNGPQSQWFLFWGILLALRNRCEILVWRSLARKTFLLNGVPGGESRKAPTFSLQDVLHLAQVLEKRFQTGDSQAETSLANGRVHMNSIFMAKPASTPSAHTPTADADFDDEAVNESSLNPLPIMLEIEAVLASLIDQGLLHGFLSHKVLRFAILGSKTKGALNAGFPSPSTVMRAKAAAGGEEAFVPGWVREESRAPMIAGRAFGPGMVVNLSGARPAGSSLA